jgi:hypothetical protein
MIFSIARHSFLCQFLTTEHQKRCSLEELVMERQRLSVAKREGSWGLVYIIGGTEADGEILPAEQADDLIARFDHEQALFGSGVDWTNVSTSAPAFSA